MLDGVGVLPEACVGINRVEDSGITVLLNYSSLGLKVQWLLD